MSLRRVQVGSCAFWAAAVFVSLLFAPVFPPSAYAATPDAVCDSVADFPCESQLSGVSLKRVPTVFKLQARVAQAKMLIGDGLFDEVLVKLIRGTQELCREEFTNVRVVNSLMNLEIGHEMGCQLDDIIAEVPDLAFQICLGGDETCLVPIALAPVPYAVKASVAATSQRAHSVTQAAVSDYARRFVADGGIAERSRIGVGYFDFETPASTPNEGRVMWTPLRRRTALNLHLAAKDHATGRLAFLDTLTLASDETEMRGDLHIEARSGASSAATLTVESGGAHLHGNADILGSLAVSDSLTVAGGLDVSFSTLVGTDTSVGNGLVSRSAGVVDVRGDSVIDDLSVTSNLLVGVAEQPSDLVVNDGATVLGDVDANRLIVLGPLGADTVSVGSLDARQDANVVGAITSQGELKVLGDLAVGSDATVGGQLRIGGKVFFDGPVTLLAGGEFNDWMVDHPNVRVFGEDRQMTFGGRITLGAGVTFGGPLLLSNQEVVDARIEAFDTPPFACSAAMEGAVYLDRVVERVLICMGGRLKPL